MKQASLAKWLKVIIVGVGACALLVYAAVVPVLGETMAEQYPEFAHCLWPWLILIWITAAPVFIALGFAWKIAANIGADRSFSADNARLLKWISALAAADAALFFGGNCVYLLLNINHPAVLIVSFFVAFAGIAIAVAAAALSHLVMKAAVLQDQSDLTI